MSKDPTVFGVQAGRGYGGFIQDVTFVGPGVNAKMGGISLQGSDGATLRRVNVSGFSTGINGDHSRSITIEDTTVTRTTPEDRFVKALSARFSQLSSEQTLEVMAILREFRHDKYKKKRTHMLNTIGESISNGLNFANTVMKIFNSIF